jgi:phosphoribosylformylglycinamidine cyclo-ligase
MRSSGLHSNGYSLARRVLMSDASVLEEVVPELTRSVGEELLEPTRIYSRDCLALIESADVHAFSHITGGGIAANVARVLPDNLSADLDRSTWTPHAIFSLLASRGEIDPREMERTFNMGLGMVAVVTEASVEQALATLTERGVDAWVCGSVRDRTTDDVGDASAKGGAGGAVRLVGSYEKDSSG